MHMKVCSKCKVEKELTDFNKDKRREDGLFPQCRDCKKKGDGDSYLKNKEKRIKSAKNGFYKTKTRETNTEKIII